MQIVLNLILLKIIMTNFFFFFLVLFIYFKRDREQVGQRQRERVLSRPRTMSAEPAAGLELTNQEIMT